MSLKEIRIEHIGKLVAWLCLCVFLVSCEEKAPKKVKKQEVPVLAKTIMGYLSLPNFVNEDFEGQVFGDIADFLVFDPKSSFAYFSLEEPWDKTHLWKLCSDTTQIEYGKIEDNHMALGPYKSRNKNRLLFRFPARFLNINKDSTLSVHYGKLSYSLSIDQLKDFYTRKSIYDGPALFVYENEGKRYSIANHSAVVSPAGEPSLEAFLENLLPDNLSNEQKYQRTLDFVSREIDYEDINKYEIFFKPNEVLMRGKSDCSGKVVLYASLLEQLKLPYLLVYTDGHILVAVPGKFSKSNKMNFKHEGEDYYFAETTLSGFRIGYTRTMPELSEADIEFIQKGGKRTRLFDYIRKDSLDFLTMEIEVEE
ncbi:MAG: hypothetical protein AAFY71_07600 [Bacteroidota bacterium]